MGYYKKFLIILFLSVLFINFFVICGYCSENVELSQVSGITIDFNGNAFVANSAGNVKYFLAKKGYKYTISLSSASDINRLFCTSENVPALNVPYTLLGVFVAGTEYNYIPSDDVYIGLATSNYWSVTSEQLPGFDSSINDLVNNVGPSALWGIFGNTTNYILIVVSVSLGLFLLVCAIRGISKTKSKF